MPRKRETDISVQRPLTSDDEDSGGLDVAVYIALFLSGLLVFLLFPLFLPSCIKVIQEYERAVIFRLGRVRRKDVIKPGVVFVFPCVDELVTRDVRTKTYATPFQQILTKDSMSVKINAVITCSVKDARSILRNRIGLEGIMKIHAQTALRDICGGLTLAEIIQGRELVSKQAQKQVQRKWSRSLDIKSIEIKNIELPKDMQRSMASEAISTREGKAKVVQAAGEVKSSRALKQAADIMATSPAALKLTYLRTMANIAKTQNHTYILPLPDELLAPFMKKGVDEGARGIRKVKGVKKE